MTWLPPSDDVLRVTLLGTGIPNAQINAFGTSTLIEAGAERILIDCGRGTVIRLSQLGLGVGRVILNVNFGCDPHETLDSIQYFAEEVMPHFTRQDKPAKKIA